MALPSLDKEGHAAASGCCWGGLKATRLQMTLERLLTLLETRCPHRADLFHGPSPRPRGILSPVGTLSPVLRATRPWEGLRGESL